MAFEGLPTLAEMNATRRAVPKYEMKSRLDAKVEKTKNADKAWDECKKAVDARDAGKCRICRKKVVKTIAFDPKRAEHHHLVKRRKEKALLTDQRNVLLVHLACHEKAERSKIHPIQKASDMFALNGTSFVNADNPIEWKS